MLANFHYEAGQQIWYQFCIIIPPLSDFLQTLKIPVFVWFRFLVVWARLRVHPAVWRVYVVIFHVS